MVVNDDCWKISTVEYNDDDFQKLLEAVFFSPFLVLYVECHSSRFDH